jgi:hypothetical protein
MGKNLLSLFVCCTYAIVKQHVKSKTHSISTKEQKIDRQIIDDCSLYIDEV